MRRSCLRRVAVGGCVLALSFGSAASLHAQGGAGAPVQAPPTPEAPKPPHRQPAPIVRPTSWWCEVNAQPAAYARLSPEEAARGFFVSQVITRNRRAGPDEAKAIERMCRTGFEVAYGSKWELVTARAQQAPTYQAALLMREDDMQMGMHRGHAQEFHFSVPE